MKRNPIRCNRWAAVVLTVWILCGVPLVGVAADDCGGISERISHGGILWTEGAVVVQGTAAPNLANPGTPLSVIKRMTQDAARLDAYRKAAGVLTGVRISSEAIAADSPRVVTRIKAFVRNARICKAKYYADGGVDMVVMVPLAGAFAMDQMPAAGTRVAEAATDYTGLVVDARHLNVAPAIAPRLLDAQGKVLYDSSRVRAEVVRQRAAVRYLSAGAPLPADLIGDRPIEVRAADLGAASPSDLILPADAAGLRVDGPAVLGEGRVVVVVATPPPSDCSGAFDQVADRHVDWENKWILARGRGRVDFTRDEDVSVRMRKMERAAEVDAQRKLLETYLAIHVDGRRQVASLPDVAARVQGVLNNARSCGAKYFKDGTAEVVMAVPLDAMAGRSLALGRTDAPPAAPVPADATGVIIDASGLGFSPVLSPRVKAFDGAELYGPALVTRAYVQQYGVAGYHETAAEARRDERVGSRPIAIRAARSEGGGVLLVGSDGNRALKRLSDSAVLAQGRVIIVTGQAGGTGPATGAAAATESASGTEAPAVSRPEPPTGTGSRVRVGKIAIP